MEDLIRMMIQNLRKQVEEKVPETGEFPVVYEREDVKERRIGASHVILKVTNVQVKGSEDERYLELAVLNYPSPYGAETVIKLGTTQQIKEELEKPELVEVLQQRLKRLIADLED